MRIAGREHGDRRRWTWAIVVVAGLVLATAPALWWESHRSAGVSSSPDFGASSAQALVTPTPPAARAPVAPSRVPAPTPSASGRPTTTRVASAPVQVRISSIGVTAPVVSVGVDAAGEMDIPEQVTRVGWYRWSSAPGAAAGSTVIAGHVDSAVQGLGALFRLRDVGSGSAITVVTADGRSWQYRVVARQEFRKTVVPLAAIFARTGSPRLTIVTCGGHFDAAKRSYDDNIVVTAVPV